MFQIHCSATLVHPPVVSSVLDSLIDTIHRLETLDWAVDTPVLILVSKILQDLGFDSGISNPAKSDMVEIETMKIWIPKNSIILMLMITNKPFLNRLRHFQCFLKLQMAEVHCISGDNESSTPERCWYNLYNLHVL